MGRMVAKDDLSRYQAVGQGAAVKAVNEESKDKNHHDPVAFVFC